MVRTLTAHTSCGLEVPPKLRRIDLRGNKLTSTKMLRPFSLTMGLQSLWLSDNGDGKSQLTNYRSLIVYMTRYLPGTNRASGIQELDGYGWWSLFVLRFSF